MTDYVVDLEELGRESVGQAGGKGALLGELLARGVPVPRGFCLTTRAYDDFLESSGLSAKIREAHDLPPGQEALDAAEAIRNRITEASIPAQVAVTLSTLYRSLGQRPRVAVRPSLAYDDQLRSPVAGAIEPHLNVSGEKELFQAIRDTWAAIWQPRVLELCRANGIEHPRLKPAVIMQVMVHPLCSGTLFTADPGTGDRDRLVLTAHWGISQGARSGQLAPDTYHVDRETMDLRYKRIVTKEVMVSSSGFVPVPKNRRNSPVLKDGQIRELCTMALGVEQIIAEPAEIEWCQVSSGEMMVLEAMPVGEIEAQSPASAPVPETGSWDPPAAWPGDVSDSEVEDDVEGGAPARAEAPRAHSPSEQASS
jgi:pyruvate,water dikinase